jgi:hypothetical protein
MRNDVKLIHFCHKKLKKYIKYFPQSFFEPEYLSWFSDWLGAGGREFDSPHKQEIFSSPQFPNRMWSPPTLLSNAGTRKLSLGVNRPGRRADRSPYSTAEVKNNGARPITPSPKHLHVMVFN